MSSSATEKLWTVKDILLFSADYLKTRGFDSARLDAELLLAKVLGCDRMGLYLTWDKPLALDERQSMRELLRRRADAEPLAYILGYRAFWKADFQVDESVLIPRADTETLVETALRLLPNEPVEPSERRILDIGTGSGCIALSLASERPNCSVHAVDASESALEIAKANCERLKLGNVRLDFFDMTESEAYPGLGQFDLVVSNPPYISDSDLANLEAQVKDFEPRLALSGGGDGLRFYRCLAENASKIVQPGGLLLLELGMDQSQDVRNLFAGGDFAFAEIVKDLAGIERVLVLRKENGR